MVKAQVHSSKHYIQVSLATVLAGASLNTKFANAVAIQDVNLDSEVREGSTIKAVYIEMWVRGGETSPGSSLLSFYKGTSGSSMTFAEQISLNSYNEKKNVFYHTQGLTNDANADAIAFIRQWFKVPKGKQRMGLGDSLNLSISAQALDNIVCGFMTYKEYY